MFAVMVSEFNSERHSGSIELVHEALQEFKGRRIPVKDITCDSDEIRLLRIDYEIYAGVCLLCFSRFVDIEMQVREHHDLELSILVEFQPRLACI